MLIIDTRDSDTIDRALRKFKKKFDQTGMMKQLRSRQHFLKPSVRKRKKRAKAAYTEQYVRENFG